MKAYVESIKELYSCGICSNLPREPRQCPTCQTVFCQFCVAEHANTVAESCPECFSFQPQYTKNDKSLQQVMKLIQVA